MTCFKLCKCFFFSHFDGHRQQMINSVTLTLFAGCRRVVESSFLHSVYVIWYCSNDTILRNSRQDKTSAVHVSAKHWYMHMSRATYHIYNSTKTCHIKFTLHVYDLSFRSEDGGDAGGVPTRWGGYQAGSCGSRLGFKICKRVATEYF